MAVKPVKLDGQSLSIEELVKVARNPSVTVDCDASAMRMVEEAANLVSRVVEKYEKSVKRRDPNPILDYGITTGFGEFKRVPIDPASLNLLQQNILLSHAAGVGETLDEHDLSNYFTAEVVRAVLVLRINAFLKGRSGIRPAIINTMVEMINKRVIPLVPIRGSVGSSGDLAPLAHLFLVLCENGRKATRFYRLSRDGKVGKQMEGTELPSLLRTNVQPEITAKEGLALTNGATFSAAMLALAVHDAASLALAADLAAAMSAEAILGCARAFDPKVHDERPQTGQIESARCLRGLLEGSQLLERANEVQDPYSVRCAPTVHGASRDALEFARKIVLNEINAATDNPLFFSDEKSWDNTFFANWTQRRDKRRSFPDTKIENRYKGEDRRSYSAGNFHGQPLALAADFLAIALAEFANISERRTQLLMDEDHNRGLPPNLIPNAGLNSGFMIAQYCAAALVSENKVLAHPASVDSVPTSSNSEDHNSMATIAARKLRVVLANTRHTLAIEFLVATQAMEWAALYEHLFTVKEPDLSFSELENQYRQFLLSDETLNYKERWKRDGIEQDLFKLWTRKDNRKNIRKWFGRGTGEAYLIIRESVGPMIQDRVLSMDILKVARLLAPNTESLAPLSQSAKKSTTHEEGGPLE